MNNIFNLQTPCKDNVGHLLTLCRVNHYNKNFLVLAGVLFAPSAFGRVVWQVLLTFALFCVASSAAYIFNDLADIAEDRVHPLKKARPLAAGLVSVATAVRLLLLLVFVALFLAVLCGPKTICLVVLFFLTNGLYTLRLKKVVLLDAFVLAVGYVLRVLAGTWAIGIPPSSWLLLCTLVLSLFLAFGKRRHELMLLEVQATRHRLVLRDYSVPYLDQMMMITATAALIFYCLYTISPETVIHHQTRNLVYTVPFVIYGLFRYMFVIYIRKGGGNPAQEVLSDRSLQVCVLLWAGSILLITRYLK